MIRSLDEAVALGEPLIDIVVIFKEGVDYELATAAVNSLGPDIALSPGRWYGNPRWRIGAVTAEGALRLFCARFTRVPLQRWNPKTRSHDGVHGTISDGVRQRSASGRAKLLRIWSQSALLSQARMMMVSGTSHSSTARFGHCCVRCLPATSQFCP